MLNSWKNQFVILIKKPHVLIKLFFITILAMLNIYDQVYLLKGFAKSFGGNNELSVIICLCHIFNYLDFYHMVIFVGFLLLIPDIICEEYMEKQFIMGHKNRLSAACAMIVRLFTFTAAYVLWLVFLTIFISGIVLHNFSLEWPHFIKVMMNTYCGQNNEFVMSLIMLPKGALQYSSLVVVILVIIRTFLGFFFLAELASLIRLITGKIRNGILIIAVLIAYEKFIYYSLGGGILQYCKFGENIYLSKVEIDLIKTTIVPFFTFRSMTDDFTMWTRYGIIMGVVCVIISAFAIIRHYKKGDLGDADRDA